MTQAAAAHLEDPPQERGGARCGAIDALEVTVCTVPVEGGIESDATLAWSSTTMVAVELASGAVRGFGYTYASPAAAEIIRRHLARFVLGADPHAPRRLHAELSRAIRNLGRPGVGSMALSAIDAAAWDLKARLLGLPLRDLIGRLRDEPVAYGSGGLTSMDDADLEEQARGWARSELSAVKIKLGRHPEADERRLRLVREAVGESCTLMADANGAWRPKEAVRWCERLAGLGVAYIEEPCSSEDEHGLRFVREHAPAGVDVAAGEYVAGRESALRLLDAGSVDILQADLTRCGGVTGFLDIAVLAAARRVPLSVHCAPAITAHPACCVEGLLHAELFQDHVRLEGLLLRGVPELVGGRLRLVDVPGNGLSWKEPARDRYRTGGFRAAA